MAGKNRVNICNILLDNVTQTEALKEINQLVEKKGVHYIVTPNVDHIIKLQTDREFFKIYKEADLVLADGMPILWAAKFLGTPLKERVAGSDLFPIICKLAAVKGYKVYLLGGRQGAAEKASKVLCNKYKGLNIIGTYSPPFGFEHKAIENDKIIKIIQDAQPDILFVGLGAPKQEKWIYSYRKIYKTPVSIGVGVSFEFIAGMVNRAPRWMQKIGLEWFWRFIMEPKKLWRRYFIDDIKIFSLVLKQKRKLSMHRPGRNI